MSFCMVSIGKLSSCRMSWRHLVEHVGVLYFSYLKRKRVKGMSKKVRRLNCSSPFARKTYGRQTFGQSKKYHCLVLSVGHSFVNRTFGWLSSCRQNVCLLTKCMLINVVDKMSAEKMSVDKMSVDKMSPDKMSVDKMSFDKIYADKMFFGKISVDKMSFDKMSVFQNVY